MCEVEISKLLYYNLENRNNTFKIDDTQKGHFYALCWHKQPPDNQTCKMTFSIHHLNFGLAAQKMLDDFWLQKLSNSWKFYTIQDGVDGDILMSAYD